MMAEHVSMAEDATPEPATLVFIRRLLLGALWVGVLGTGGELILLGHVDSPTQWIPLIGCGAAVALLLWHARMPSRTTVIAVRVVMIAFIVSGAMGIGLHYNGNVEFERELHPDESGWPFLRHTLAGATPLLAPGSMVLLGLIGLAQVYRHPVLNGGRTAEG